MTVSRVINTPGKVSPVTLERVKQVVAKIGYVPNAMARAAAAFQS
jgi:DNA-binding LacI/PurR family transcriptional regulator